MAWWSDWRVTGIGILLSAAAMGALLLRRVAGRRRERRVARWRRDHARRLPWALFQRRRSPLRLVDGRVAPTGSGPDRPSA